MKPSERKKARHYAMQAIYQWQMAGAPTAEIAKQFFDDCDFSKVDKGYFLLLLNGVSSDAESLDKQFEIYLDRALKDLGPVELAILRLSTFELANCIDVPYKVVINEGIDLGKKFGATDSHKYINSILDKMARDLRKIEIQQ